MSTTKVDRNDLASIFLHFCNICVHSTILVEPYCTAYITKSGDIRIEVSSLSINFILLGRLSDLIVTKIF